MKSLLSFCSSLIWLLSSTFFLEVVDSFSLGFLIAVILIQHLRTASLSFLKTYFLIVFGRGEHFISNKTFYMQNRIFYILWKFCQWIFLKKYDRRIIVIPFKFLFQTTFQIKLMRLQDSWNSNISTKNWNLKLIFLCVDINRSNKSIGYVQNASKL